MFSLKSERAIKFYTDHPDLDFDAVNIIIVDLLEKLVHNMSNTLNQNLSLDMLKEISSKLNSLERRTQHIDETTKNYIDNLKTNIENSVSSQKEYIINNLRDLVNNDTHTNYRYIDELVSKNHEILTSRISDNINCLPKEILNSTISLTQLTDELQKTHNAIANDINNTISSQQSHTDFAQHIYSLIDSKYNQLNSSITARIETMLSSFNSTNNDILERVQPIKLFEEFFHNNNNSNRKGKQGESKLEPILSSILPHAEIKNTSKNKESGDFIITRNNNPTILIDTKDYKTNIPTIEIVKIIRDIDKHKCNGILISQNSGITHKDDFEINIHNNYVLIFLHNVNYNETKILSAIQIIDVLYPIIQQQVNIQHESITSEQLNQINKEFQLLITKKKQIIDQIEQNNKDIIKEIGKLELPSISDILTSKFSQSEQFAYICNICNNFSGKNSKALSAHQRGCKKKHNINTSSSTNISPSAS